MKMRSAGLVSALIYTSISVIAAALFLVITTRGEYTLVARFGGAGWIFLLSMIILMPIVIPRVKRRYHR